MQDLQKRTLRIKKKIQGLCLGYIASDKIAKLNPKFQISPILLPHFAQSSNAYMVKLAWSLLR